MKHSMHPRDSHKPTLVANVPLIEYIIHGRDFTVEIVRCVRLSFLEIERQRRSIRDEHR